MVLDTLYGIDGQYRASPQMVAGHTTEAGRRDPDTTVCSYLQAISNDPEEVERAYAPTPAI